MTPDPVSVDEVCRYLESYAPARLAEDWDNTGLLIGNMQGVVQQVMTCLTVTPETVKEAIDRQVQLIVTHHPLPFLSLIHI